MVNDRFFSKPFVHMLDTGLPRAISYFPASSGTLIFTDACYEKDADFWRSDVGGFLYNAPLDSWRFLSLEVSSQQLALLGKETKDQLIFDVEMLAAIITYILWAPLLKSQFCFHIH